MTIQPRKRDPPEAPDGGWGWVIVIGCNLMLQMILIVRISGVFFNDWRDYFDASATAVGAVGSAHMAAFLFMGPLGGYLCRRIGPRKLALLSGVIAVIGLLIASQAKSLVVLILSFGVLAGIGMGFGFVSILDIISQYFKKRFATANSISNSGSGISIIVLPIVAHFLVNLYSWNGAFFVWAAVSGNICVCAMLFRPVQRISRRGLTNKRVVGCEEQHDPPEGRRDRLDGESRMEVSTTCEGDTDAEEDGQNLKGNPRKPPRKVSICNECDSKMERSDLNVRGVSDGKPYRRIPTSSECDFEADSTNLKSNIDVKPYRRTSTSSVSDFCVDEYDQNLKPVSNRETPNSTGHAASGSQSNVTYDPVTDAINFKFKERRPTRGSVYLGHFVRGSGLYLIKTCHRFDLLCLTQVALGISYSAVQIHFVPYATGTGISKLDAALLLSFIGIGSLFGRLTSGPIVDCKLSGPVKLYFALIFTFGVSIMILPVIKTYAGFAVFAVCFGFTSGMYKCHTFVLIRMFVGADRLASGIGIFMPFLGIGNVIGPLLAGWLYDIREHYDLAFYICGSIAILAAFLVPLMPFVERIEKKNHEDKEGEPEIAQPLGSVQSLAII